MHIYIHICYTYIYAFMLSHVRLYETMDWSTWLLFLGIFQASILEWLPFPTPEDPPNPGMEPMAPVSALAGKFSTIEPLGSPNLTM